MKMLAHRTPLTSALPFDLNAVKSHLRADGLDDDAGITNIAHAAAAELEHFAQIALLNQTIRVTIFRPTLEGYLNLPIGPVDEVNVPVVTIDGEPFDGFRFVGGHRPYLQWQAKYFDRKLPDRITIEYQAGFGETAAAIPRDLAQALMDQAALHYDGRSPMSPKELTTSPHMARIGARYRGVHV